MQKLGRPKRTFLSEYAFRALRDQVGSIGAGTPHHHRMWKIMTADVPEHAHSNENSNPESTRPEDDRSHGCQMLRGRQNTKSALVIALSCWPSTETSSRATLRPLTRPLGPCSAVQRSKMTRTASDRHEFDSEVTALSSPTLPIFLSERSFSWFNDRCNGV